MKWYRASTKLANGPIRTSCLRPALSPKLFSDFAPATSRLGVVESAARYEVSLYARSGECVKQIAERSEDARSSNVPDDPTGGVPSLRGSLLYIPSTEPNGSSATPIASATMPLYPVLCVSLIVPTGIAAPPPIPSA